MRYPLDSVTITGQFYEVAQAGSGLPDINGTRRHIGLDLRAAVGTPFFSPGDGKVTEVYTGSSGTKVTGVRIGDKDHRFLHLSKFSVSVGDNVKEGQVLGLTGNSGNVAPHLHWDVRKAGTAWSANLNNYINPSSIIGGDMPEDYKANSGDNKNVKEEFGFQESDAPNLTGTPWKSVFYNWIAGKGRAMLARIKELENENLQLRQQIASSVACTPDERKLLDLLKGL